MVIVIIIIQIVALFNKNIFAQSWQQEKICSVELKFILKGFWCYTVLCPLDQIVSWKICGSKIYR